VIDSLPEKLRGLVPTSYDALSLRQWLDASLPVLNGFAATHSDSAAGSANDRMTDGIVVDAEAATLAKALGIDPTQLVKEMKSREVS
jgi:hypothetical protein